jgi:4a-hydroxytetrahydrobiopterin dehydratase
MVTEQEFSDLGLSAWQVSDTSAEGVYECAGFTAGGRFVARIAEIADAQNHHPDVSLAYPGVVRVTTTSHDVEALTGRDLTLARAVDEASAQFLGSGE